MSVILISATLGVTFFHDNYAFGISFASFTIAGNAAFAVVMSYKVLMDNWKLCKNPLGSYIDLIPFVLQQLALAFWYRTSLYDDYICLIVLLQGVVFSKMVCKLLICAVGEQKYSIFHLDLLILYLGFAITGMGFAPEGLTFLLIGIYITVDYVIFVTDTITTIAKYLGIYVFSIKKPE